MVARELLQRLPTRAGDPGEQVAKCIIDGYGCHVSFLLAAVLDWFISNSTRHRLPRKSMPPEEARTTGRKIDGRNIKTIHGPFFCHQFFCLNIFVPAMVWNAISCKVMLIHSRQCKRVCSMNRRACSANLARPQTPPIGQPAHPFRNVS